MSSIEILDDHTINKIAAGEVIERPSSALKELLENSADSGATRIEIDFDGGGKNELRVLDDGSGMSLDELPLSLARHATSKLKTIEDLEKIQTFGFRGEALASLAAVSELTLHSGLKKSKAGAKIISRGGKLEGPMPASPLDGTQVIVKNIFFNVPARQKFLKSDAGETAAIKKVVKSFALSHPELSLVLRQGGKAIHQWSRQDFFKRACQVLDVDSKNAIHLKVQEGSLSLEAALVLPELSQATQSGIWIFVQSRPVTDRAITQAIFEGYRNLIMQHQYPQVVLSLTVDASQVDVNVHPTKAQVKFLNPSLIFRFVSSSIRQVLEEKLAPKIEESLIPKIAHYQRPQQELQSDLIREAVVQYNQRALETPNFNNVSSAPSYSITNQNKTPNISTEMIQPQIKKAWSSLQLIGQYANTYLVTQSQKALVLVDQHAAHERVLFERLKKDFTSRQVEKQAALLEELVELSAESIEALTDSKFEKVFSDMGFELARRGPTTLSISTRPAFLVDVSLSPLFERLGEQILDFGSKGVLDDLLGEIWASMSCHGAIRAGRVLSQPEMQALLIQMDEFSFSSFCPHGRPVSVQIGLHELEKMFKRIV